MTKQRKKSLARTVVKAIDIFQCFDNDREEKGIQEISRALDLPESTTYRIVNTLEYKGILIQNADNRKYRMGLKLLKLVDKVANMHQWKNKAKSHMIELNEKFNETVNLAVRDEDRAVYIETVSSTHVLRPTLSPGAKYPIHCTGLGKCLLLDVSRKELDQILESPLKKYTPDTIVDKDSLLENLEEGREKGFVVDKEEFQKGIICIAAPIRGFGGKIAAALSMTIPTVRFDDERFVDLRDNVISTAQNISRALNY